jgi:hypothetical protein
VISRHPEAGRSHRPWRQCYGLASSAPKAYRQSGHVEKNRQENAEVVWMAKRDLCGEVEVRGQQVFGTSSDIVDGSTEMTAADGCYDGKEG